MQSSARAADWEPEGAVDDAAERERDDASRSAELGAAMEEVLAEVWRAESWWATEDRIDTAVRYLPIDP